MLKKIIELVKNLYLKINCILCCKSQCEIQIGRDTPELENNKNDENYKDE